jgi:integrase
MARLEEPNLLICETCLDTGTRISEVTGLMIKHVDLETGTIYIAQRSCRGNIDVPKTAKSKRMLTLGDLTDRYKKWIAGLKRKGPNDWVFPQEEDLSQPRWDSGVRKALKTAAWSIRAEGADKDDPGLDFPGFGHTPCAAPTSLGGRTSAAAASRPARSRDTRAPQLRRSTRSWD